MDNFVDMSKELIEGIMYHLGLPLVVEENLENEEIQINVGIQGLGRNLEKLINEVAECMGEDIYNFESAYEINRYFTKVLTQLLFGKDYENEVVFKFIRNANKLAGMTYENETIETGIYVADEDTIEKFCERNQWSLIRGSEADFEEIININKPMRKLVDNREFAYCFDRNLKYIGIISNDDMTCSIGEKISKLQQKDLKKSLAEQIEDICDYFSKNMKEMILNEIKEKDNGIEYADAELILDKIVEMYQPYNIGNIKNEVQNILYIEISNERVKYYLNSYTYIEEKHGEWRLYEYLSLVAPLVGHLFMGLFFAGSQDNYIYVVDVIYKLIMVIKEMSIKNRGGLIILCEEESKIDEIKTPDVNLNFKKLFGDIDAVELLKISNEKLMGIISVDGGTIINSQLELMDFGRILKNNMKNNIKYGARTNAALAASEYGLAIKISEDGDVTLYRKGKVCKRFEKF